MKHAELLDKCLGLAPESLRKVWLVATLLFPAAVLLGDLFLAHGVVLESLRCLGSVDFGGEDIVQAELPWKHVHHNPEQFALVLGWIACLSVAAPYSTVGVVLARKS